MADWYCSSAAWTAIAQFTASHAYSVGDIVRPLTAPSVNQQYAFRCTTAGTSSTEPNWSTVPQNNATITTGGATFTNVSGQSTYGWSACYGNIQTSLNPTWGRIVPGDRCFIASDHTESSTVTNILNTGGQAFGVIQFISVNRLGNVPPQTSDALSGASYTQTSGNMYFDPYCQGYWQGITFNISGNFFFSFSAGKNQYYRNCTFVFTTGTTNRIQAATPCTVTLDNTVVQFSNAGQALQWTADIDFKWINTPSAIGGTAVPTTLFGGTTGVIQGGTFRGVDLSALTTSLYPVGLGFCKILLDSCRIASGLNRSLAPSGSQSATDEIELVNCYDGTNIISERHTAAGDLTTNRSTTLHGGAQDDIGLYSHQLVSSTRSDGWVMTLNSFWMDVENTQIGSSYTATVEIISSSTLNNTDINLTLEYLGISGSSLASFANSIVPLASSSALPTSSASWNSPPSTPVKQQLQVTFTPQTAGRLRGQIRLGKPITTVYVNPQIKLTAVSTSQAKLGVWLGTYVGGGAGSYSTVNAHWNGFKSALNRTPAIIGAVLINSYQYDTTPPSGWGGDYLNWTAASLPTDGSVAPLLGMAFTNTTSTDTDFANWISGTYDNNLQNALNHWKSIGITKMYIRCNWEFNANAFGSFGVPSSGQVSNWVAAYKHLCNVCHTWGNSNGVVVKMVWSPDTSYTLAAAQTFSLPVNNFFPAPDGSAVGGKYIDVIGHDWYMNGYSVNSNYNQGYTTSLTTNANWSPGTFVLMAQTYGCSIGLSETGDGASSFDNNNSATDGVMAGVITYLNTLSTLTPPVPVEYVTIFDVSAGGASQFTNGGVPNVQAGWRCCLGVGGTQPNPSIPIPVLMSV